MFTLHIYGCEFENYNRENIRSWAIALGNCLHRSDVWEFTRRLIGEPRDSPQPQITEWTFWQLACWCQTDGAYGARYGVRTEDLNGGIRANYPAP